MISNTERLTRVDISSCSGILDWDPSIAAGAHCCEAEDDGLKS